MKVIERPKIKENHSFVMSSFINSVISGSARILRILSSVTPLVGVELSVLCDALVFPSCALMSCSDELIVAEASCCVRSRAS